jgi:hypothetical protein
MTRNTNTPGLLKIQRHVNRKERVMLEALKFRRYAQECQRLAQSMPEHRAGLLRIADAWIACAEKAEGTPHKNTNHDSSDDGNEARAQVLSIAVEQH